MAPWSALSIKRETSRAPLLFVKGDFTDSTYTVLLTDLVYLWTEQLDRRAIMRRAMNEDTTIDPTNGPDQLQTLLDHLSSCLNGKSGTSAMLRSDSNQKQLNVTLTSQLPAPLEPLRWPMNLKLDVEERFSAELLQPALRALASYRTGLDSLIRILQEKDNVIRKLQDKIEVSGIDLGAVFPGMGVRKSGNIRNAHRVVPGLAEFDYASWLTTTSTLEDDPLMTDCLPRISSLDERTIARGVATWWEDLPADDLVIENLGQSMHPNHARNADSNVVVESGETVKGEDPRDDTGTGAGRGRGKDTVFTDRRKSYRKGSHSSTSSEEDLSQFEQMQPRSDRDATKRQVTESPPAASENPFAKDSIPKQVERSPAPPKRIGKLGGKKQDPPATVAAERVPETQVNAPAEQITPPPKKIAKLGKIGGAGTTSIARGRESKQADEAGTAVKRESPPSQDKVSNDVMKPTAPERETSQERADRRRAELKRQLEEKKRVPGAKKKQRKF